MRAEIKLDVKKDKPVIRLIAENEQEGMSLELMASYNNFTIQLEYDDIDILATSINNG